MGSPISGLVA